MRVRAVGVYPVVAPEPCHLVELEFEGVADAFDLTEITQPSPGVSRDRWQVPWDEHFLGPDGTSVIDPDDPARFPATDRFRVVFFFHYFESNRPLATPAGESILPAETPKPDRLRFIHYESPC